MNRDKKNSVWLAAQYIVTIAGAFVTLKLNIDHFGKEIFGTWLIFASLWGVGSIMDLGFATAIVKYIAEAKRAEDNGKINSLISTGTILFLLIGIVLVFLGIVVGQLFYLNNNNLSLGGTAQATFKIFYLLGVNFFIYYNYLFLKSILEGLSDFVLSSKIVITSKLVLLFLVILITYFNADIIFLAYAFILTSTIQLIINLLAIRFKYPLIHFTFSKTSIALIKKLFKFSVSVQFSNIFFALIDPIIKYIIGSYAQVSIVPLYEVGRRFSTAISGLYFTSFRTILPKTSVLIGKKEYKEYLENEGLTNMKLGILYSGVAFGIGTLFISLLIIFWFQLPEAILIFLILSIPEAINNFGYTLYNFVLGIGKASLVAIIQLINLVIMTLCTTMGYILLKNNLGLLGYTISVLISNIILMSYTVSLTGVSYKDVFKRTKLSKLIFLITLMLIAVLLIQFNFYSVIIVAGVLSLISTIYFGNDIMITFSAIKRILSPNFKTKTPSG